MKLSELINQVTRAYEEYGDLECHAFYEDDAYDYAFGDGADFCLRIVRSDAGDDKNLPGVSMTSPSREAPSIKATAVLFYAS